MDTLRNRRRKKRNCRETEINDRLIKDRTTGDMRTLIEQEEEKDYYKEKRVSNFWNNNYIEYESNCDKNRNLSLDEYYNKIELCLRKMIIDLQNFDTSKILLTIAINFISSIDTEKEQAMDTKSGNIKSTSYNMQIRSC